MLELIAANQEFTGLTLITVLFLIASTVVAATNKTVAPRIRQVFIFSFVALIFISLADWVNYVTSGVVYSMRWFHVTTMAVTFALAPFLPVAIAHQVFDDAKLYKPLLVVLMAQGIFELATIFGGFVFEVDAHNVYSRGRFYIVYMLTYLLSAIYLSYLSIKAGTTYQCANLPSILAILSVLIIGVAVQVFNPAVRTTWPSVSMAVELYFLFYVQMVETADPLTMLLNRSSYESAISDPKLPFTYVAIDVDKFKEVNDTFGHAYGDFVLKRLSRAILETYGDYGHCYRVGGDEFCAILDEDGYDIETLNRVLARRVQSLKMRDDNIPSLSVGYARADEACSDIATIVDLADQNMYAAKRDGR